MTPEEQNQQQATEALQQKLQQLQQQYSSQASSSSSSKTPEDQAIAKEVSFKGKGANNFYRVEYKGQLVGRVNRDPKSRDFYYLTAAEVKEIENLLNTTPEDQEGIEEVISTLEGIDSKAKARGISNRETVAISLVKATR